MGSSGHGRHVDHEGRRWWTPRRARAATHAPPLSSATQRPAAAAPPLALTPTELNDAIDQVIGTAPVPSVDGQLVIFAREAPHPLIPPPAGEVLTAWPLHPSASAPGRLADLVHESSRELLSLLLRRAESAGSARAGLTDADGNVAVFSILCFGPLLPFGFALIDHAGVARTSIEPGDVLTRIRCRRNGEPVTAQGPLDTSADVGLFGEALVADEDRPALRAQVAAVLDGEPYGRCHVTGNSPIIHFDVIVVADGDEVVIDLRDESHRVQSVNALAASRQQFNQLFDTLQIGVFSIDLGGGLRFQSERLRQMFGPIATNDFGWMQVVLPEDRPILERALADLAETRQFNVELRAKTVDGDTIWIRITGSDIRRADGELEAVVGYVEDISTHRSLQERIRHQAEFDGLTGLPNRSSLQSRLRQELTDADPGSATAVLFIDLDGFKLINDTQGHGVGDSVLIEVAQRFRRVVRPSDVIGRFGGDEFLVVVADVLDISEVETVAARLHDVLATPVHADGRIINVSASIGIALSDFGVATADQLIGDADIAMYEAKAAATSRTVHFDASLRSRASQRFDMTADLRHARRRRELRLQYQPIVDLQGDGRIVGAEALVRWEHPRLGMIAPDVFVPLAEEIGLINDIGEWVVERACADLDRLRSTGHAADDFVMSVNASAQQFNNVAELATSTLASLNQFGLHPAQLRFELTESVPLTKIPEAATRIRQLTSYGFGLAIDDFGTGYSSLGYLTMLPFDVLKLDVSLVAQLENRAPARAVVDSLTKMAGDLGFQIVAEGIESEHQRAVLRAAGVHLGQGFRISAPLSLSDLQRALTAHDDGSTGQSCLG